MSHLVAVSSPIDLLNLIEGIESRGKDSLEQLGGFAYLAERGQHHTLLLHRGSLRQLAAIGVEIHASVIVLGANIAAAMETTEQKITPLAERAAPQQGVTIVGGLEKLTAELERRCHTVSLARRPGLTS